MSKNKLSKRLAALSAAIVLALTQSAFAADTAASDKAANNVVELNLQQAMEKPLLLISLLKLQATKKTAPALI